MHLAEKRKNTQILRDLLDAICIINVTILNILFMFNIVFI